MGGLGTLAFGDPMNQKTITWGLAISAFVATLAISSWHEGLWHSGQSVAQAPLERDATHIPTHPFDSVPPGTLPPPSRLPPIASAAPIAARPVLQTATPPPPAPPPPMPATESDPPPPPTDSATDDTPSPVPDPDLEQFQQQADRAGEHSARSH
jgi:hypothetical protein